MEIYGYINIDVDFDEVYRVIRNEFDKGATYTVKNDVRNDGYQMIISYRNNGTLRELHAFFVVTEDSYYVKLLSHSNRNSLDNFFDIIKHFGGIIKELDYRNNQVRMFYVPRDSTLMYEKYIELFDEGISYPYSVKNIFQ